MAARAGREPTTLPVRVIASTNAPPCPIPFDTFLSHSPCFRSVQHHTPYHRLDYSLLQVFLSFPLSNSFLSLEGIFPHRYSPPYFYMTFCITRDHTSVTFRPRSTSVAGTVSNAEGFACCCRVVNDEDGYRVGTGQGLELAAVDIGHSWLERYLAIIYFRFIYQLFAPTYYRTTGAVDTSGLPCLASRLMDEWGGAAVISLERLGFKSNPATNSGTGEVSKRSNLCITVSRTSRVSTCAAPTAPMFSCTAPMFSCTAPMLACIASMEFRVSA